MTIQILCINKDNGNHDNPHEAISYFGWVEAGNPNNNGRSTRAQVVNYLEKGNHAYVLGGGTRAYCYVRQNRHGTKFVQTHSDGRDTNNLLSLPECK